MMKKLGVILNIIFIFCCLLVPLYLTHSVASLRARHSRSSPGSAPIAVSSPPRLVSRSHTPLLREPRRAALRRRPGPAPTARWRRRRPVRATRRARPSPRARVLCFACATGETTDTCFCNRHFHIGLRQTFESNIWVVYQHNILSFLFVFGLNSVVSTRVFHSHYSPTIGTHLAVVSRRSQSARERAHRQPGPGQYDLDAGDAWQRRSFNVTVSG